VSNLIIEIIISIIMQTVIGVNLGAWAVTTPLGFGVGVMGSP